jgi:hypothetical protein
MRHIFVISVLLAMLAHSGCVDVEQFRQAAQQAEARLEQMEQLNEQALITLEAAREAVAGTDDERVHRALDLAERAAERAAEMLPVAREGAQRTAAALAEAEAAADTPWWRTAISAVVALLGVGATAVQTVRARSWSGLARHGLQLAEELKRSAPPNAATDRAIARAEQWQLDHGLKSKVDSVRKRRTHV